MAKHLTTTLFSTFFIGLVATLILIGILKPSNINQMCDMSDIVFGFGFGYVFSMALFTTTIYLNHYKKIRSNNFYSLLSFFLLPILIATAFTILMGNFLENWQIYCAMIFPYLFILIINYFRFRKYVKNRD